MPFVQNNPIDVLLFSPLPPPIGGNTVHVERLVERLINNNYRVKVIDWCPSTTKDDREEVLQLGLSLDKIKPLLVLHRELSENTIVHIHVSSMGKFKYIAPLLLLIFKNNPTVLSIHSGGFVDFIDKGALTSYKLWILKRFTRIITVNERQKSSIVSLGIDDSLVSVIPAFIRSWKTTPMKPVELSRLSENKICVLTSGYLTRLYNYEVLIDCIKNLDPNKFHFAFAFYHQFDDEYEREITHRMKDIPNASVFKNLPPADFLSLVSWCDTYVRTATIDGDAVAVRESLELGKRVIATNSVKRPEGVVTFSSNDSERLGKLILQSMKEEDVTTSSSLEKSNSFEKILEIYRHCQQVSA